MEYLRLVTLAFASFLFMSKAQAVVINSYTAFYEDGSSLYVDFKGKNFDFGYHYLPAIEFEEAGITEGFPAVLTHPNITSPMPIGGWDPFDAGFAFFVDISDRVILMSFSYFGQLPDVSASNIGWTADGPFAEWLSGGLTEDYFSRFVRGSFSYTTAPVHVPEPPMTIILFLSLLIVMVSTHRMGAMPRFRSELFKKVPVEQDNTEAASA